MRGCEERLRRRGAPVDQQPAAVAGGQPEPPDVDRVPRLGDDPPQAQVEAEPTQHPQLSADPVHLQVAVHGLLPVPARATAYLVQPFVQLGDLLLETLPDGGEVPLVIGDQCRVRLGVVTAREIECLQR